MKKRKFLLALLAVVLIIMVGTLVFVGCNDTDTNTPGGGNEDIDNPDIPLVDPDCEHDHVTHVPFKASECTKAGNKEYWYCTDCHKYFSDSAMETETTLAAMTILAGHKYGDLVEAESNKCQAGMKAHYFCEACETYFTEDKKETTVLQLMLPASHDLKYNPAEPAGCEGGYEEYWECNDCGKFFGDEFGSRVLDDDLFDIYLLPDHKNVTHFSANAATCMTAGNIEYWYCNLCHTYFEDEDCEIEMEQEDTVVAIVSTAHNFGDFAYNYAEAKYERVCLHNNAHVDYQVAGTEEYPYLANDLASLNSAIAKGGYVKLEADIETNAIIDVSKSVVIDLNENTLSNMPGVKSAILYLRKDTVATIVVKNGTIDNKNNTNVSYSIKSEASTSADVAPKLIVENVVFNNNDLSKDGTKYEEAQGVNRMCGNLSLFDYTQATLTNCTINGGYDAVAIKANAKLTMTNCTIEDSFVSIQGNGGKHGTEITLKDTNITSYYGIYHPQDGVMTIDGCTLDIVGTAVEVRAGHVTITDSTLSSSFKFDATPNGDGNSTAGCAVGISQHSTNKAIEVSISGSTLTADFAVFEMDFMNTVARDQINITIGEGNTYNGCIYSQNCELDGEHVFSEAVYNYTTKQYEMNCLDESNDGVVIKINAGYVLYPFLANDATTLKAAITKGGYIKLVADIDVDAMLTISHKVTTVVDLNEHEIKGTGNFQVFNVTGAVNLTLKNGSVNGTRGLWVTGKNASITLDNVNITSTQQGVISFGKTFKMKGGSIVSGAHCLYISPVSDSYTYEDAPEYSITLDVTGTKLTSTKSMACLLRATKATFTNVDINAYNTCMFALRGTTLEMNNCTMSSETNCGVQGNGTEAKNNANCGIEVEIVLNNCTVTESVVAVYLPQVGGKTIINGGSYTGSRSAVEVRAGSLEIKGGAVLTCTGEEFKWVANSNGSTIHGSALAVSQHTTNDAIDVKINGATLIGIYAIYERDVQDNLDTNKIAVTLGEGNTFNGGIYSQNCENIENTAGETPDAVEA